MIIVIVIEISGWIVFVDGHVEFTAVHDRTKVRKFRKNKIKISLLEKQSKWFLFECLFVFHLKRHGIEFMNRLQAQPSRSDVEEELMDTHIYQETDCPSESDFAELLRDHDFPEADAIAAHYAEALRESGAF